MDKLPPIETRTLTVSGRFLFTRDQAKSLAEHLKLGRDQKVHSASHAEGEFIDNVLDELGKAEGLFAGYYDNAIGHSGVVHIGGVDLSHYVTEVEIRA